MIVGKDHHLNDLYQITRHDGREGPPPQFKLDNWPNILKLHMMTTHVHRLLLL
jgi:hypothetical protein